MGRKRGRRVDTLKKGYAEHKPKVRVTSQTDGREKILDRRVEIGYRKGYKLRNEINESHEDEERKADVATLRSKVKPVGRPKQRVGIRVELRYTKQGTPVLVERKSRSKPSRARRRSHKERWARKGDMGTYRRQTTEGRKTGEDARQKELGGVRRLWVK